MLRPVADLPPIQLQPRQIDVGDPNWNFISKWPFADFFVSRLLVQDIPQRALFGHCSIWIYQDEAGQTVGLGALDFCKDYLDPAGEHFHPYIPLLAINPTIKSKGYGTMILDHLLREASTAAKSNWLCERLIFLEVYVDSEKAIRLYRAKGFVEAVDDPILDPDEAKHYLIMVRSI